MWRRASETRTKHTSDASLIDDRAVSTYIVVLGAGQFGLAGLVMRELDTLVVLQRPSRFRVGMRWRPEIAPCTHPQVGWLLVHSVRWREGIVRVGSFREVVFLQRKLN